MQVLICIVNYRTDDALCEFVASLAAAWSASAPEGRLVIAVLDNSGKSEAEASRFASRLDALLPGTEFVSTGGNLGYFGALPLAQERSVREHFDYVAFANADLIADLDFFRALSCCQQAAAVLAPSILVTTAAGEMDQNPAYEVRLSRKRLRFLRTVYGNTWLFAGYCVLWRARDRMRSLPAAARNKQVGPATPRKIYAAHGAMFIFADVKFFQSLTEFKPFLFGEEIFVAEEARSAGLDTLYVPEVRVRHSRSKSMSSVPQEGQRKYLFEALTFLLDRYHDNSPLGVRRRSGNRTE